MIDFHGGEPRVIHDGESAMSEESKTTLDQQMGRLHRSGERRVVRTQNYVAQAQAAERVLPLMALRARQVQHLLRDAGLPYRMVQATMRLEDIAKHGGEIDVKLNKLQINGKYIVGGISALRDTFKRGEVDALVQMGYLKFVKTIRPQFEDGTASWRKSMRRKAPSNRYRVTESGYAWLRRVGLHPAQNTALPDTDGVMFD